MCLRATKRVCVWHLQNPMLLQQGVSEKSLVLHSIFLFIRLVVLYVLVCVNHINRHTMYCLRQEEASATMYTRHNTG
jgi:hypothetical protein